ncbi:MAG TPA: rhodanese-like domain-containing protein [Stellaceae bacterium]|nr:rhodanese-like domain-containing protein [Stellaceae bacterium]
MFKRVLRLFRRGADGPAWVEANELRRRLRRGDMNLIIDVRGPDEFDGPLGHIPGALNVPLASIAGRGPTLANAGLPIVLVCLTDKRSSQAAAELAAAGVRDVAVLKGGMKAWRGE